MPDHNGWNPVDIASHYESPEHWNHTRDVLQSLSETTTKRSPTCWSSADRGAALKVSGEGQAVELPSMLYASSKRPPGDISLTFF